MSWNARKWWFFLFWNIKSNILSSCLWQNSRGFLLQTSVRLCLLHIHFIIMTTNRKELNGEWRKSIQIDLADPCWVSQGGGVEGWTDERREDMGILSMVNFITFHWVKKSKLSDRKFSPWEDIRFRSAVVSEVPGSTQTLCCTVQKNIQTNRQRNTYFKFWLEYSSTKGKASSI